jgi:tetratricopeptide (TPR) repeat protein
MSTPQKSVKHLPSTVLVLDPDDQAARLVTSFLERMRIQNILVREDSSSALKALDQDVGAVVMEWRLVGSLSGIALLNKLRANHKWRQLPVVVLSNNLDEHASRLLEEFPLTAALGKPTTRVGLESKLASLAAEAKWYTRQEHRIRELLDDDAGAGEELGEKLKELVATAPSPGPLLVTIAQTLRRRGLAPLAEAVLMATMDRNSMSLMLIGELGKLLFAQRRYDEAIRILEPLARFSPKNIARLCDLGAASLSLDDVQAAAAYFGKAAALDPDDAIAAAGLQTAVEGVQERAAEGVSAPDQSLERRFASLLNTAGIALVNSGKFSEGLDHYATALQLLSEQDVVARLMFNLGLGYSKWGRADEAQRWFKVSQEVGGSGFARAKDYLGPTVHVPAEEDERDRDIDGMDDEPLARPLARA